MMQKEQRVEIIDMLRGWALLIVVISNYLYYAYSPEWTIHGDGIIATVINGVESILFSAKGWTLLFTLFGFGFGVIYAKKKGQTYFFIIRRMLVLFVFAFINSLFYDGDILRDYAFLGLLILFFIHFSAKTLLYIAGVLFLFAPLLAAYINTVDTAYVISLTTGIAPLRFSTQLLEVFKYNILNSFYTEVLNLVYSVTAHYIMFTCMILGLAIQKSKFLETVFERKNQIKKSLFSLVSITIVLWGVSLLSMMYKLPYIKYFSLHYWIVLTTMLSTSLFIILLYTNQKLKKTLKAFSWVGRMTFTNYLTQNLIAFFVFQGVGLGLFHHMPFYFYFLFAIAIYLLQIGFSYWWLKNHVYGPLEWLWRQLSDTKNDVFMK